MELLSFDIPRKQGDHAPVVIAPIGDIQWAGHRGPTAKELLKRHIDRCMSLNAWFIGLGDYTDFASPSNRQRLRAAALYDTAEDVIDDKALDLVLELYQEYLAPTKGRWLGMLHGHHWAMLRTGETTDQRLCQMLGTTFLGTEAFVRLRFVIDKTSRVNVTLWAHHGCGGGQLAGSPLNKLEQAASRFSDADVYIMGHTTKMPAVPIERIYPRWHGQGAPDLTHKRIYLVNSGGFARGHVKGAMQGRVPMGGYVEQGMMAPASLGAPIIRITPRMDFTKHKNVKTKTWAPEVSVEI